MLSHKSLIQWEGALAVAAVAMVVEWYSFPESVERRNESPSVFFSVEADCFQPLPSPRPKLKNGSRPLCVRMKLAAWA